jgi:CRISPR-associated exonuclease Cas4
MLVQNIPQNEHSRYKVNKGRDIHKYRSLTNKDYLRKKLNVVRKEVEQMLYSEEHHIHGKVDEILFLENGEGTVLDYKYAEYKDKIFNTYKMQSVSYALLVQENYNIPVKKGYIVYTRSKNKVVEIEYTQNDFEKLQLIIGDILKIIEKSYFPKKTKISERCIDCCYSNLCIK